MKNKSCFVVFGTNLDRFESCRLAAKRTGLLAHLIFRYLAYLSKWGLSFSRLVGVVRGTLWIRRNLIETLCLYGTVGPVKTPAERPKRLYFQAVLEFGAIGMGRMGRAVWRQSGNVASRRRSRAAKIGKRRSQRKRQIVYQQPTKNKQLPTTCEKEMMYRRQSRDEREEWDKRDERDG